MKKLLNHLFSCTVLIVALLLSLPASGQKKNEQRLVEIEIIPNHPDWTYTVGEEAVFTISVNQAHHPLTDVTLSYAVGAEKMEPVKSGKLSMNRGVVTLNGGTMQEPGFMTCLCEVEVNGELYENYINVAFSPAEILPTQQFPPDFETFWQTSIDKTRQIAMEPLVTLVPEKCTPRTNVYHVRLQHYHKDTYIYGWLCVPKKEGTYPALLCVPGAGVKPVPAEVELAEMGSGMITLAIGVNGIPLDMEKSVYDNLRYGVLKDYGFIHLDSREKYYYHRIYTGCVRAIDYLTSLPSYDGTNIGVMGGSQGGALAIVTAALDSRIKAVVAFYPALCDVTGYLHGRAGGWPHIFAPKHMALNNTPAKVTTTQYYDVVNFARILQAPGFYSWGYNDPTCPPTSLFAAYNVITAPKQLLIAHITGHWRLPEQNDTAYAWLYKMLTPNE